MVETLMLNSSFRDQNDRSSYEGQFNARWMSPIEVAHTFVPLPPFYRLVESNSSVLLGPRGSGKTTLLKMLTRPALETWKQERRNSSSGKSFKFPSFEAIYVPADVRWLQELQTLSGRDALSSELTQQVQRVFLSISTLMACMDTFEFMIPVDSLDDTQTPFVAHCVRHWKLPPTLPRFSALKLTFGEIAHRLRGVVNKGDVDEIRRYLNSLDPVFYAHILDGPDIASKVFEEYYPDCHPMKWGLCFDELEIAPVWFRQEVLEALRSTDQRFLLKLTWSPIRPAHLKTEPEEVQDYSAIRLWHSHPTEARDFCGNLTKQFLEDKFKDEQATPSVFLSYSALAIEKEDDDSRVYDRQSVIYEAMKKTAQVDPTFRALMQQYNVDPADPYTDDVELRDRFHRKVKPVVLLRHAFKTPARLRSRKFVVLYAGKQAVYAMSEGNPRWLLALLTELYSSWCTSPVKDGKGRPVIPHHQQARALTMAAKKFKAHLRAVASDEEDGRPGELSDLTLWDLVERIGRALQGEFLGDEFQLDPIGGFVVDEALSEKMMRLIVKGIEKGAFIHVGEDNSPYSIAGNRYRLSYMLAPIFKLPLRNYRAIGLQELLSRGYSGADQLSILSDL